MSNATRKVAVINAATSWAEAIREHGPEAARPFRENFLMALDDALTATDETAVEALAQAREVIRDLLPAWLNGWAPQQDIIDRAEAVLGGDGR